MAITHVKVTYSVQPRTAQRVAELATKWGVPKSEVIRRVVEEASCEEASSPHLTPREALRELMSTPSPYSKAQVREWKRDIRLSRGASDKKRDASMELAWKRAASLSRPTPVKRGVKSASAK